MLVTGTTSGKARVEAQGRGLIHSAQETVFYYHCNDNNNTAAAEVSRVTLPRGACDCQCAKHFAYMMSFTPDNKRASEVLAP